MSPSSSDTRSVTVENENGLHMRPAYLLAERAGQYACEIEIVKEDMRVDAKSALSILTLGATRGTRLQLHARGPQAGQAITELAEMIGSPFPEEISGD